MSTTILFANGANWIELIIFLVIGGIALLNKVLAKQREAGPQRPARPVRPVRPAAPQRDVFANPMESPQNIDEFLDEVVGGQPQVRPQPPRPAEVVILKPRAAPPPPPPRPRADLRKPVARPVPARARPPRQPIKPPPPSQPPLLARPQADQVDSAKQAVSQAAESTQLAGELRQGGAVATAGPHRGAALAQLLASLRSPADLRRAVLLREVLGPPLALRRRHS